jgi:hypothetical protein
MSLKRSREPRYITADAWSGLAAPAAAGAAVHSTAPWYIAVPVLAAALGLTIWRRRRGGGGGRGPFGRGPSGGS